MAIFEVKVFQTYYGINCVNTFHYQSSATPAAVSNSFALTAAMGFISGIPPAPNGLFQVWKNLVSDQVTFTEVQVKDVYDVVDFYTLPLTTNNTGVASGANEAPFVAYGVRTNRVRQDIRRGFKRFVGVLDAATGNAGTLDPAYVTALNNICDEMSATLTYDDEGNTLTYNPVVLGKEKYTTPAGNVAYRYYPTVTEQEQHIATSVQWSAMTQLRSQVSRQVGRGV